MRLTPKDIRKALIPSRCDGKPTLTELKQLEIDRYNKLADLEDIEDELGIDLITLFKALKQGHVFVLKNSEIVMSCDYNLGLTGLTYDLFCKDINRWLLVKDYGKSWALTKEELEK